MATQQVAKQEWKDYLAAFSAHNQTRRVTIDLENKELGEQRLVDNKPLLAIEPDIRDEYESTITLVAGDPEDGEPAALTHRINQPTAVWVKQDEQGRAEALGIESADGRTILQFT